MMKKLIMCDISEQALRRDADEYAPGRKVGGRAYLIYMYILYLKEFT